MLWQGPRVTRCTPAQPESTSAPAPIKASVLVLETVIATPLVDPRPNSIDVTRARGYEMRHPILLSERRR